MTFCSKQSAELAQQELHDKTVLPGVGVVCVVRGRRWMWGGGGNGVLSVCVRGRGPRGVYVWEGGGGGAGGGGNGVCVCVLSSWGSPHCCAWLGWKMPTDGFVPSAVHCLTVFPLYR